MDHSSREYYQAETREGFFIRSMMKRSWAVQLDVTEDIDRICQIHGIPYFAAWGTLLGAVRHKGFIPWDDDIDLCMFRKDYERFKKAAVNELTGGHILVNDRDDKQKDLIPRIASAGGIFTDEAFLKAHHGDPYPAAVDIFVLDDMPFKEDDRRLWKDMLHIVFSIAWNTPGGLRYDQCDEEIRSGADQLADMYNIKIDGEKLLKGQLMNLCDYLAAMYNGEGAEDVCMVPHTKHVFKKSWFDDTIMLDFEDIRLPVPAKWNEVLTVCYGNEYMKPVMGSADHAYPIFGGYEERLRQEYEKRGIAFPKEFED